jgi:hypothetical protein
MSGGRSRVSIVSVLTLFTDFQLQHSAHAVNYAISGNFSYQITTPDRPHTPLFRDFEVLVHDCTWKITVVLLGSADFKSFVYSYDGKQLIHYGITTGGDKAGVTVESCPVPQTMTSPAGEYVWFEAQDL